MKNNNYIKNIYQIIWLLLFLTIVQCFFVKKILAKNYFDNKKSFVENKKDNNLITQKIIAKIDKAIITNFELQQRYKYFLISSNLQPINKIEQHLFLQQILEKSTEEKIILNESRRLEIINQQDEIEEYFQNIFADEFKKSNSQFFWQNILQDVNLKEVVFNQINSELSWQKILQKQIFPKIKIEDYKINQAIEQKKMKKSNAQFLISQIIINSGNQNQDLILANKIYEQLQNEGANFTAIKQQLSQKKLKIEYSDLDWLSYEEIKPNLLAEINKTKNGNYTKPIIIDNKYHIFKLIDKRTNNEVALEDVEAIKNNLITKELQNLGNNYLLNLHKQSYIEIDKKALNNLIENINESKK